MDLKKLILDRTNTMASDQKRRKEEKGPEEKEKEIKALHAQAHILEKFLEEIVQPCFEEAIKIFHETDTPCYFKLFPNDTTNSYDAIQLTFSLTERTKESRPDHNIWPHLKYRGSLYFHLGNYTNDEIETEFLLPSGKREIKSGSETIDSLSRSHEKIEKDIRYSIIPNWEKQKPPP